MENQTPPEPGSETSTGETVTEKLANEAAAGTNGNGNGHHVNGAEKNSAEPTPEPAGEGFTMFDDLNKETEEDKKREERKNNPGAEKEKNPFDDFDPKNDVTDDDLSQESMTLAEANAAVSLNLAALDMFTSFACCAIRDDFSIATQLKYRIHPWRKKAIQIPWVRLKMQPTRRSKPGWALALALVSGTLPTIGLALIDNYHDRKKRTDPNYKERTDNAQETKGAGANPYKVYVDPRGAENPGFGGKKQYGEAVVDVDFEEVKDTAENNGDHQEEKPEGKRGRHAKTCPKHLDRDKGICNCK